MRRVYRPVFVFAFVLVLALVLVLVFVLGRGAGRCGAAGRIAAVSMAATP